jgi:hypothetical protein
MIRGNGDRFKVHVGNEVISQRCHPHLLLPFFVLLRVLRVFVLGGEVLGGEV